MAETQKSLELRAVAQAVADALPASVEEVVLTGSVSRGVADDVSDIELLIVTPEEPDLDECFSLAAHAGLTDLGTWGPQGVPTKRVSGYRDGAPLELVWWSRATADAAVDAVFEFDRSGTADALANGVALRTSGLLAGWQERLRHYPDELAQQHIEDAALTWGGFAAAGLLTIVRQGERLSMLERLVDDAIRVTRIVFALNHVWQPTTKRLADRIAPLEHKPERLAERIEEALTEPDERRAVLLMTELQADTVALAPDGPNIVRARKWLSEALEILGREGPPGAPVK
ncbi:MAG TPA: nucleotidyltransferase domain-containing protein [Gaiellaceae bacterium]